MRGLNPTGSGSSQRCPVETKTYSPVGDIALDVQGDKYQRIAAACETKDSCVRPVGPRGKLSLVGAAYLQISRHPVTAPQTPEEGPVERWVPFIDSVLYPSMCYFPLSV